MDDIARKREPREPLEERSADDLERAVWDPEYRATLRKRLARSPEGKDRSGGPARRRPRLSPKDDSA